MTEAAPGEGVAAALTELVETHARSVLATCWHLLGPSDVDGSVRGQGVEILPARPVDGPDGGAGRGRTFGHLRRSIRLTGEHGIAG